jgi:hypothetical protein
LAARWSIISNKYYLDTDNPQPREIDILAYKVADVQGVEVVTTLIVSCKKSERNVWAFLTRKADLKNPNVDFNPLHIKTDYKPISFQLNLPDGRESYIAKALEHGVRDALAVPDYQVFALQQMLKAAVVNVVVASLQANCFSSSGCMRSGLSQTSSFNSQLRVDRDQRCGLRCLASA